MLSVYKFPLVITDYYDIRMLRDAKILKFDLQHGVPTLWALVDKNETKGEDRRFRLAGTGHDLDYSPGELIFIGTIQMQGGSLIYHLFEIL